MLNQISTDRLPNETATDSDGVANPPFTFFVGQKMWMTESDRRCANRDKEVEIAKVARRWVTLTGNDGRFDKNNLRLDGGEYTSPGRVWLSLKDFEDSEEKLELLRRIVREIRYGDRPDLTLAEVRQAASMLRVPHEAPQPSEDSANGFVFLASGGA